MTLEVSDVEKIAHLARLGIDPGDIPEYSRNLSDILAFVEQLNAVDTAGESLKNLRIAEILKLDMAMEEGTVRFRARVALSFKIETI